MRDGWRQVTLGEVLTEIYRPVATADLSTVRFAGVRWYAEGVYQREPVDAASVKTKMLSTLRSGDVTYNRMWATKASFGVAGDSVDGCHVTNDFPIFAVNHQLVDTPFVKLIFQCTGFQSNAADRATGTTERKRLKQRDFLAIRVDLPSRGEQRRIVDLIAAVDDAIETAEAEELRTGSAMRDLWRAVAVGTTRVDAIGTVAQGRNLPKSIQGTTKGVIPWFKIADMAQEPNVYGYTSAETSVSASVLADHGGRLTPAGSIAFPRVGASIATEKKRILETDGALDENHIVITPRSPGTSDIILAAMESVSLGRIARDGAVPSLNMRVISSLEIEWPATADLPALDAVLRAGREQRKRARATADALRALRSNLLAVLLSGQHEVPSSYDRLLEGAA